MARTLLLAVFVSAFTLGPACEAAADTPDDLALSELEHQRKIVERLRELGIVFTAVRDHIDPRKAQKLVHDEPFLDTMLKQAEVLARELGSEMRSAPHWVRQTEERIKQAKAAAAAADVPLRLVQAAKEARTSSGAAKLNDLAQVTKDLTSALPVLVSGNPVMGMYVDALVKGVEGVARDAERIARARDRTNEAIAEAGKALGRTHLDELLAKPHPLDDALSALESHAERARQRVATKVYGEYRAALGACLKRHGLSKAAYDRTRLALARSERQTRDTLSQLLLLSHENAMIDNDIRALKTRIAALQREAAGDPEATLKNRPTIDKLRQGIQSQESERKRRDARRPAMRRIYRDKLEHLRRKRAELSKTLELMDECMALELKDSQHVDAAFLEDLEPGVARRLRKDGPRGWSGRWLMSGNNVPGKQDSWGWLGLDIWVSGSGVLARTDNDVFVIEGRTSNGGKTITLRFVWSDGSDSNHGTATWTLGADGKTFDGTWQNNVGGSGRWFGKRPKTN